MAKAGNDAITNPGLGQAGVSVLGSLAFAVQVTALGVL